MEPYVVKVLGSRRLELTKEGEAYVVRVKKNGKQEDAFRLTPTDMCALRDATLNLLR